MQFKATLAVAAITCTTVVSASAIRFESNIYTREAEPLDLKKDFNNIETKVKNYADTHAVTVATDAKMVHDGVDQVCKLGGAIGGIATELPCAAVDIATGAASDAADWNARKHHNSNGKRKRSLLRALRRRSIASEFHKVEDKAKEEWKDKSVAMAGHAALAKDVVNKGCEFAGKYGGIYGKVGCAGLEIAADGASTAADWNARKQMANKVGDAAPAPEHQRRELDNALARRAYLDALLLDDLVWA